MTDIGNILDSLFADLEADAPFPLPTLPTKLPTGDIAQVTDIVMTSHTSHTSHLANEGARKTHDEGLEKTNCSAGESRVTSSYDGVVGSVGSVGSGAKTPAETTLPFFPLTLEEVGSVGSEGGHLPAPFLDLNHAAPQRLGPRMGETDRAPPPPGDPLPISPADVRAGVARELRALEALGRTGPAALRDAVEITAAKIRNSEALAESQWNGSRCHVCDESLNDDRPVVAVLTGKRGSHLHMHDACHAKHRARRIALVDRIMTEAGYGPAQTNGAAA